MNRLRLAVALTAWCCALGQSYAQALFTQPGSAFQSATTRAQEADEFSNPGMLWVTQGETVWHAKRGAANQNCAACHRIDDMKGVAARYPAYIVEAGKVLALDGAINRCVSDRQRAQPFAAESNELLALTAFVTRQSKGLPIQVSIEGPAAAAYARGKSLYFERIGQMNLACTHCHDRNWGKTLLAESISQGHPDGWPAYRLEWQALGSLQRRLRACFYGVRAAQPAYGSDDLVALELYLAKRAQGLKLETPGVRR